MTEATRPDNYVYLVLGRSVRVRNVTAQVVQALKALGGHEEQVQGEPAWVLDGQDEASLATLLGRLRDLGAVFGGDASGWPPAEVFNYLRGKGLVQGPFEEVLWRRPGDWFTRTR